MDCPPVVVIIIIIRQNIIIIITIIIIQGCLGGLRSCACLSSIIIIVVCLCLKLRFAALVRAKHVSVGLVHHGCDASQGLGIIHVECVKLYQAKIFHLYMW